MNSKIEFTYYEINALNKLLGEIKTESYLSADEIHFFALSPFIISAFEKIHKELMNHKREQIQTGELVVSEAWTNVDPKDDFQLTDKCYFGDQKKRLLDLGQSNKDSLIKMDKVEREEYSNLVYAPFMPTEKQKQDIIDTLELMTKE